MHLIIDVLYFTKNSVLHSNTELTIDDTIHIVSDVGSDVVKEASSLQIRISLEIF